MADTLNSIISGGVSGAGIAGPWGAVGGAALGVLPSIIGLFTGNSQKKKANAIKPIDPGFQANTGILNNQRIVNEKYNNYTLPGLSGITNQLDSNYASGLAAATQGATDSSDVLDSAVRLASNQNDAVNSLGLAAAQGKEGMFGQVLQSNEAAGNELVRRNAFDEERYQAQLREKAALTQASAANTFNSADSLATLGGSLLNYRAQPYSAGTSSSFKTLPAINYRGTKGQIVA